MFPAVPVNADIFQYYPPTRTHAIRLVELFIVNVDPFIRIIHKPSFFYALRPFLDLHYKGISVSGSCIRRSQAGAGNSQALSPEIANFQQLFFSVLYAATVSIEEARFQELFPESFITCRDLSSRYRKATEIALANADFVNTEDLVTLQALTIFLVSHMSLFLSAIHYQFESNI